MTIYNPSLVFVFSSTQISVLILSEIPKFQDANLFKLIKSVNNIKIHPPTKNNTINKKNNSRKINQYPKNKKIDNPIRQQIPLMKPSIYPTTNKTKYGLTNFYGIQNNGKNKIDTN